VQDMYFRVSRLPASLPNEDEARSYLLRMATNAATATAAMNQSKS